MKIFLRLLLSSLTLLRFLLLIIVSLFFLLTVLIESSISKITGNYNFWSSRNWGKNMLFIIGFVVKKNERPNLDKFLLMPNHRSYIDIFLMAAYSPSVFVAKAEIKKWPILGQSIKATKAILVKRNEMKSLIDTMKKIRQSVEQGISVTIFPEGTTSLGPALLPFKSGTFKIAAEINAPIIPCAISYLDKDDAWVSTDTFVAHFFRQWWKPISKVEVRFGEPISGNEVTELKNKVKKAIEVMLEEME